MISVKEATKNYINGGKGKTTMPLGRMFVFTFLAGMFIALAELKNNSFINGHQFISCKSYNIISIPWQTCHGNY